MTSSSSDDPMEMRKVFKMVDFDSQVAAVTQTEPVAKKAPPPLPAKKAPPLPPAKPIVDSAGFTLVDGQRYDTQTGEDLVAKAEAGIINPPESAGIVLAATPEELADIQGIKKPVPIEDGLEKLELHELKAVAAAEGVEIVPRQRTKTVIEAIRASRASKNTEAAEPEFSHPTEPPAGSLAFESDDDQQIAQEPAKPVAVTVEPMCDDVPDITPGMSLIEVSRVLKRIANDIGAKISLVFEPDQ